MSNYRIYIESETSGTIPKTLVTPVFSGLFTYKLDEKGIYYVKELADTLKFLTKVDYDLIIAQRLVDDCEHIIVTIEKLCEGAYVEEWVGFFSVFTCTINFSRCWFSTKAKPNDEYQCFDDAIDTDINAYSVLPIITATGLAGSYETQTCSDVLSGVTFAEYIDAYNNPLDTCLGTPSEWTHKSTSLIINGTDYSDNFPYTEPEPFDIIREVIWHRETIITACVLGSPETPAVGSGWVLLTDDCVGSSTATYWRPPTIAADPLGDYVSGRLFNTLLQRVVDQMNCGLTIKSDFFNINAVGDAPSNIAYTYAVAYLQNLTFHQKSDIKDKTATNPSSGEAWDLSPEDLFGDLEKLFNVYRTIVGTDLILEHYSFYEGVVGSDDSAIKMLLQIEPEPASKKREEFYYLDKDATTAFLAKNIIYPCGDSVEERKLALFSCDLGFMEDTSNASLVSDDGFVLISTVEFGGANVILDNNEPLAWPNLHDNLHLHGRLYKSGNLNGLDQTFLSWRPYEKQEPYYTTLCCPSTFEPTKLRTTPLGNGKVVEAKHNIVTGRLEIQVAY